jgi:hypothetical protein
MQSGRRKKKESLLDCFRKVQVSTSEISRWPGTWWMSDCFTHQHPFLNTAEKTCTNNQHLLPALFSVLLAKPRRMAIYRKSQLLAQPLLKNQPYHESQGCDSPRNGKDAQRTLTRPLGFFS